MQRLDNFVWSFHYFLKQYPWNINSNIYFQEWFLPHPLCRIVPYVETVALTVSVFTLVTSAVHEFRTMFFSKCSQMSPKSAKRCVLLIWIMSVIVSLPHGLFHQTYEFEDDNDSSKTIVQVTFEIFVWLSKTRFFLLVFEIGVLRISFTSIPKHYSVSQCTLKPDGGKATTSISSSFNTSSQWSFLTPLTQWLLWKSGR